jgi:predicted Zn-dependent peptidase
VTRHRLFASAALVTVFLAAPALPEDAPPAHPRDIKAPALDFQPPDPAHFRLKLANGLTVFLVPDDSLPSVRMRAYVRTGTIYDPEEKEGLAGLTFATLRAAGAGDLEPADLEQKLDALAASIEADASETRATVEVWTPSVHLDTVLDMFANVVMHPRFEGERVKRIQEDSAAEAKNDEDDSSVLATRRMRGVLYGDHPLARFRSEETLKALTRNDLLRFHKKNLVPGRVVLSVSGRFEREAMAAKLEKAFGSWKGSDEVWPQVEDPVERTKPAGILVIDRPDMSAAYIELGHLGIKAGSPDEAALTLTDHIWGSGSFTSRVVSRIRTDEGLAYTCGSDFDTPPVVSGIVRTYMQCGAAEASYALKLALEEAKRLADSGPTPDELVAAKAAVIGRFPSRFTTSTDRARALAEAALDGLPDDYYPRYRERIAAVTADDVKAAAAKYYGMNGLSIVVVGPLATVRRSVTRGTSLDEFGTVRTE